MEFVPAPEGVFVERSVGAKIERRRVIAFTLPSGLPYVVGEAKLTLVTPGGSEGWRLVDVS